MPPDHGMRFWWVNQNQTFAQETSGGYLWSPKRNKNGARNPFYEFMREVAPGDLVLFFEGTHIRAIGVARSHAYECPKPPEFGSAGPNWERIGWKGDVSYHQRERSLLEREAAAEVLRAAKKEGCDPKEWLAMPPLRGLSNEAAGKIISAINGRHRHGGRNVRTAARLSQDWCWQARSAAPRRRSPVGPAPSMAVTTGLQRGGVALSAGTVATERRGRSDVPPRRARPASPLQFSRCPGQFIRTTRS